MHQRSMNTMVTDWPSENVLGMLEKPSFSPWKTYQLEA